MRCLASWQRYGDTRCAEWAVHIHRRYERRVLEILANGKLEEADVAMCEQAEMMLNELEVLVLRDQRKDVGLADGRGA